MSPGSGSRRGASHQTTVVDALSNVATHAHGDSLEARTHVERGTARLALVSILLAIGGAVLAGCWGDDDEEGGSKGGGSINVAIVDNPQMQDLAHLTPSLFTHRTNIKVNYVILDEGTLREVTTRGEAAGGREFDAVMIGPYEAPQFGRDGHILDLTRLASSDRAYNLGDIIPSVRNALSYRGRLYAAPFYGESSFLMYRKDVLNNAGIEMPAHPTWTQVADIARRIDTPDRAGICLRGKAGWGELGATFGTMLNTFGGTWWTAKRDGSVGRAMVDRPAFRRTLQFYVDLVRDAGEPGAARAAYNQCLAQYLGGKVAMWYDATVAALPFRRRRARRTWPGGTSRGRRDRDTSRRLGRGSRAGGRRFHRARAGRPTGFRSTCEPPARSLGPRWTRSSPRLSRTRALRNGRDCRQPSPTSASPSFRTSPASAPSSSLP
jgi:hypothetical protein